jgi:outer membrane protein TolC
MAGTLLFSGCSAAHYRKSADHQVYAIVQQVEKQVFGHTNAFTIDTPYSSRDPKSILPAELIEDRLQTNLRTLTIEDALSLSVDQSRRYQAAKETLYLEALSLTGQRHAFTPQFFGTLAGGVARTSDGEVSADGSGAIGVTKLLQSGGKLGVTLANDVLRYYTGDPRASILSSLSVNLAQPLLRGFGRNNPEVEALTQAERNVVYAVRDFAYFQNEFALEIVNDYFALLAEQQNIQNRYTNYLGRVQATKRLEARAHDREQLADVDQVRQAELTAKNNYVNSVALYRNALDQFKIKLGLPVGEKLTLDPNPLREIETNGLVTASLDAEAAYRFAVSNQVNILTAIDQFEDSKRKIRVAADRLRAELNLIGNASVPTDDDDSYTSFDPDKYRAGVGLELNLPFDRLSERNSYRATLVSFESQLRNLTLTLDNLKDRIQSGLRTLDQRRQNYEIQKNALTLADRRVRSTTLLLEAGRAEVRDLVDSQDAQISTQTAVTAAQVDYQQARLELLLQIGALDASVGKFWLRDQLANLQTLTINDTKQPASGEQPVLPPEAYLTN